MAKKESESWHKDGVNMQEWLAVAYFMPWLLIGCLFAYKAYTKGLTEIDVDYFYILSWPTLLSACFYYGFKVVLNLKKLKTENSTEGEMQNETWEQGSTGDGTASGSDQSGL